VLFFLPVFLRVQILSTGSEFQNSNIFNKKKDKSLKTKLKKKSLNL